MKPWRSAPCPESPSAGVANTPTTSTGCSPTLAAVVPRTTSRWISTRSPSQTPGTTFSPPRSHRGSQRFSGPRISIRCCRTLPARCSRAGSSPPIGSASLRTPTGLATSAASSTTHTSGPTPAFALPACWPRNASAGTGCADPTSANCTPSSRGSTTTWSSTSAPERARTSSEPTSLVRGSTVPARPLERIPAPKALRRAELRALDRIRRPTERRILAVNAGAASQARRWLHTDPDGLFQFLRGQPSASLPE